ncbi:hypothetical protein B0H17DRAFT_1071310, partial [Mycena rosella]
MTAGHIDCYLDCSSFYSFLAFVYLLRHREVLAAHDVSIEFHPILLGGVNVGSGNKPPWTAMWTPPHVNPAVPGALRGALLGSKLFSETEVDEILAAAAQQQWKDRLLANTKKVLDQGAFGAPWMWVRNAQGTEEPFFGSDRFHHMWVYLGLPWKESNYFQSSQRN